MFRPKTPSQTPSHLSIARPSTCPPPSPTDRAGLRSPKEMARSFPLPFPLKNLVNTSRAEAAAILQGQEPGGRRRTEVAVGQPLSNPGGLTPQRLALGIKYCLGSRGKLPFSLKKKDIGSRSKDRTVHTKTQRMSE